MNDDAATEVLSLSRDEALASLEVLQRVKAANDDLEQRLLARIDQLGRGLHPEDRWDRESVSTILRCAPVTARRRLEQAATLVDDFPHRLDALAAGRITRGHAWVLLDVAGNLDPGKIAKFEHRVLRNAESTSVSEFRARCARAVLAVDPSGAEQRHDAANAARRVDARPGTDGMTDIRAHVATDEAARVMRHLNRCADTVVECEPDGGRGRDAIRADVLVDLLSGGTAETGTGQRPIQVTVAMSTLINLDELPGEVDGEPVTAGVVRRLASDRGAWWRPVLIDRDGHLEAVGARQYRPSAMLRRTVELHDRICQFPGCRRRAVRCEVDHVDPFDHDDPACGGLTELENLHALCKRHHRLKHEAGWSVTRKDGRSTWRSPEDRRFEKAFEPYLDPPDPGSDGPGTPPDDPPPF